MPVLCVVVPLVAAAILGLLAKTPAWTRADTRVADAVHELRHPWLTGFAELLHVAFLPPAVIVVSAGSVLLLAAAGRYGGALLAAVVVTAGWAANHLYKAAIGRPRPAPERQLVAQPGFDSFPSGHVAVTLALVVVWCLLTTGRSRLRLAVAAGAALVAAQAFARVYLGVHHPTDVLGALLVAGGAATAAVVVCRPVAARLDRTPGAGRGALDRAARGAGQVAGPKPPHGS